MALSLDPRQQDDEESPTSIVAPWNMDIDPETMQLDPAGYMSSLGEGIGNAFQSMIPAQAPQGPVSGMQEIPEQDFRTSGPIQGMQQVPDYEPHEESHGLINAIEKGYADKSFMNPVKMIRDGVAANNHEMIEKGHTKLTEMLSETHLSPTEKFMDMLMEGGVIHQAQRNAQKIAADIIAHELQRPGSTQAPGAEEAARLGLIQPHELMPGSQIGEQTRQRTIPSAGFQFGDDGGVTMTPATSMESTPSFIPGATLTPMQQQIVAQRQRAISTGTAYKIANSASTAELNKERAETERAKRRSMGVKDELTDEKTEMERYKREFEMPAKIKAHESVNELRKQQVEFYKAKTEWTKNLPALRRELQGGTNPFEMDAMKRVHTAIKAQEPIEPADWLVAKRWLTKGIPEYGLDFMGNTYSKVTGESSKGGKKLKGMQIPTPPDTSFSPEQSAEVDEIHNDMLSTITEFLGGLLSGSKEDNTSTAKPPPVKLPTPKTPEEAAKLKPGTQYLRPDGRVMVR